MQGIIRFPLNLRSESNSKHMQWQGTTERKVGKTEINLPLQASEGLPKKGNVPCWGKQTRRKGELRPEKVEKMATREHFGSRGVEN